MKTCHSCGKEIQTANKISRRDTCPVCHADLHCCLNCAFFDISAPKRCSEPVAEMIKDKNKANFCDYFVIVESRSPGPSGAEVEKARKTLRDLFNK